MRRGLSRRQFLASTAATGTLVALRGNLSAAGEASADAAGAGGGGGADDLPRIDFHVHLDGLGIDKAVEYAAERGVRFGIVEHAGTRANQYPVVLSTDDDLRRYLAMLDGKPVFKGVQAEFTNWRPCFSKEMIARLDYVLTDALTFPLTLPEKDGAWALLWKSEQVKIEDREAFMDRYVEHHVRKITREPIDILANVGFLPAVLEKDFDALWTPARMKRVIDAAVACHVAIEINSSFRLPRPAFLKMAKAAGAKFSFGSNGRGDGVGRIEWSLGVARELGLTRADLFTPAPPGKKPIEVRTFD